MSFLSDCGESIEKGYMFDLLDVCSCLGALTVIMIICNKKLNTYVYKSVGKQS